MTTQQQTEPQQTEPQPAGVPAGQPTEGATSDRGFPENTPIADMNDAQRAAYFKHQNRQTEGKLSAYNGVKPEDVQTMQNRIAELEREKLSESDKAIAEARDQAAAAARTAAETEAGAKWGARLLEAVASAYLSEEQQKSFLAIASADKFMKDGEFDVPALMGHLTAIYGTRETPPNHQRFKDWGQNQQGHTPNQGAALGLAEAQKRFGTQT